MKFISLALLFFFSYPAFSQIVLDREKEVDITSEIEYFIDSTGEQDITRIKRNATFSPAPPVGLRLNDLEGNLWLRITLQNPYQDDEQSILIFKDPSLFNISLFEEGEGESLSGASVPQHEKDVAGNHNAFNINTKPLETEIIYVKIQSDNFITTSATVFTDKLYHEKTRREYIFLGLFYGVMMLIMVYSIFLFVLTRMSVFLIYGSYILGSMLFTGTSDGFTHMYLNPLVQATGGYLEYILAAVSNMIALIFMDRFLHTQRWSVQIHKVIKGLVWSIGGILTFTLLFTPNEGFEVMRPVGIVVLLIVLWVSGKAVKQHVHQARYFFIAFLGYGFFITLFVLNLFRIIHFSFLVQYSIHFGIIFNLTVLSIALGMRVYRSYQNSIRAEREKQVEYSIKNEALEKLVWDRTKAIIQKENELRSIIDNSDNLIWLIDTDYILRELNTAFATSWELTFNKKLKKGKNIVEQIPGDKLKELWRSRYDKVFKGEAIRFRENYEIDGEQRFFEINVFPIRENRIVKAAAFFSRDITERMKYEQELKDKNIALQKVNQELDSFVYSASHDLKAPLASIQGLIALVRDENDPEHRKQYYSMMERSINRLDQFIRDIIDYSRNTRVENKREVIDITEMINSILDDLKYMNTSGALEIALEGNEKYPFISDPTRMRIILRNLISNAFRYGHVDKEDPQVSVSWIIKKKEAVFFISDKGPGIDKEHIERIFEMFYRAHETSSGSGLGLYIVKETLYKMDGDISVESGKGKGTTFKIVIPNYSSAS
ncbi:7TM diverse intracellular signaling domain-containing protein [Fulvivirga sedimenti]|uniref:histidine kinase n=1 Tax=Fulvivirga sedimenti TaxID=2879465 RepID=A0A9X1L1W0_9BACT|nr:7TM diverse intracellular signaling domain-containing protein [Fulvivirga sedimenti]MCA6078647.1 PAS domain S-box protein [Fulvivirga sedimenti]